MYTLYLTEGKPMDISECSSVQLWLNKACGSENTRKGYLNKFEKFCNHLDFNPDRLVEEWKNVRYDWKKRQRFLDLWSENVETYIYNELSDFSPWSKVTTAGIMLSFFKHQKISLEVETLRHPYVKYHNRDITKQEIERILDHCTIRNKAYFLMMLESGLRPTTLCQLRYSNIKSDFERKNIPMTIRTPSKILKDRVGERFSFIGEDGFRALKEYLSTRQPLNDDDFVFVKGKHGKNSPVTPSAFSNIFCNLVLKLGLDKITEVKKPKPLRLYCLRKYFRNNIRASDTAYREFWMGHKFGTDEHYLTRDVEKHKEVYAEAYPSLRIYEKATKEVKQLTEELEKTKGELETTKKQVKALTELVSHLSSPEYLNKRIKEAVERIFAQAKKENPDME